MRAAYDNGARVVSIRTGAFVLAAAGLLDGPGALLVDLLADTGLVGSKSQARTAVTQGGAYVNNVRAADVGHRVTPSDLVAGRYVVLRRGKKDHHLVRFA